MLESVSFLARSGRIPGIAAWGGSVLKVRPVIRMKDGRGSLVALVRRSPAGVRRMHEMVLGEAALRDVGPRGERLRATVFQADAPDLAEHLVDLLREDLPRADLSCSEMTSAMAVHTGPGVVGYALYAEPPDESSDAQDDWQEGWGGWRD
jgi:fatty acid-binding protein DegV